MRMLRKTTVSNIPNTFVPLLPKDKTMLVWMTSAVIIQCIAVFILSATVLQCVWSPYNSTAEYDVLARIMYLYDKDSCEKIQKKTPLVSNLVLSNETYGLDILPIKNEPPIDTISTKFSAKTRTYVKVSIAIHSFWMFIALILRLVARRQVRLRYLKYLISLFFYFCTLVTTFDISMGLVYIAHIQQSLTKGMIIRYSGWSTILGIRNNDDFGAWLPAIASLCWLRGCLILLLNIYICHLVFGLRRRIQKREVKTKIHGYVNKPVPDSKHEEPSNDEVLFFRAGDNRPYSKSTNF